MEAFTQYLEQFNEIGYVQETISSLVYVSGLPSVHQQEMLIFENGVIGMVGNIAQELVEVFVFASEPLKVGTQVARTNQLFSIPVGEEYLGQVIDPFGKLLDKFLTLKLPKTMRQIDSPPGDISTRQRVSRTFDTGITLVDILITLGKGQRELIIGDRKTGKTNFLFQTLVTQARQGAICIYAAIGKKRLDIKSAEEYFKKQNILNQTVIMAATSDDPASIIYITPYCAMTLAEYFRDQGHDVVLVLDDLYTHAKFYRELSLLGKRFPARNSYPADIFYTHARLLERAGNFVSPDGQERAITCLPVAETVQGDMSGYIQTNLMSMTDGHIYFDIDSFTQGRRPAINPFLSVSRVGRQTQTDLKRSISREVLSFLTLHERMERFSHFGAEVTPTIRDTLSTGERIQHFFDQKTDIILDSNLQLFLFTILWFGYWNNKPFEQMGDEIEQLIKIYNTDTDFQHKVLQMISANKSLNDFMRIIAKTVVPFLNQLFPPPSPFNSVTSNVQTTDQAKKQT